VKLRVLFLCETNSVQSPIAEAFLRGLDPKHFEVSSAGFDRRETHPLTVEVMKDVGIDLGKRTAKPMDDVLNSRFDFVITLGDRARTECPKFSGAQRAHWQFADPLAVLDPDEQRRLFRSLRDQIAQRVRLFVLVHTRFDSMSSGAQPDAVRF
jgi:protein-tyrosine-phosphatase